MNTIEKDRDQIRAVAVSCRETNLSVLRAALAVAFQSHVFTVLASKEQVDEYVGAVVGGSDVEPHVLLLDLDSAPETSWWCVECSSKTENMAQLPIFGLADTYEQSQADPIFGHLVAAVLPIPRTPSQAKPLVDFITLSWAE